MESFEYKGLWWFPDDDDFTFVGTLAFDPVNGGVLELTEKLVDLSKPAKIEDFTEYDFIYGNIGGAPVTLRSCYVRSIRGFITGFNTIVISVDSIHINHYFSNTTETVLEEAALTYSQLYISYTHLNEWMGHVGFERDNGSISIERFEPIEAEIADRNDKLTFWYLNNQNRTSSELSLKNLGRITLERRDHSHIQNYRWYTDFHLVNLLSVATGKPNFPSKVQGRTTDGNFVTDIYFRTAGYEENRKAIRQDTLLFTLDDIKEGLATYLSTWIEKCDWLWQPTDLYIQVLYDSSLRPQTKFLLLAQALEAYHSNASKESNSPFNDKYMPSKEYKLIAKHLKSLIPESVKGPFRSSLESRIDSAHVFTLRSRLIDICDHVSEHHNWIIDQLVGDRSKFASEVTKARNQLTHHKNLKTTKLGSVISAGLKHTTAMEILFRFCVLIELGLPTDKTKELLERFRSKNGQHFKANM